MAPAGQGGREGVEVILQLCNQGQGGGGGGTAAKSMEGGRKGGEEGRGYVLTRR